MSPQNYRDSQLFLRQLQEARQETVILDACSRRIPWSLLDLPQTLLQAEPLLTLFVDPFIEKEGSPERLQGLGDGCRPCG